MISVIIPVLNESSSIAALISFALANPRVSEVIVIDDGSIDGTPELARESGATVVTSTLLGKGASMEDGMWTARNEILVYLDGDLQGLRDDLIDAMTGPIERDGADFVKARFTRTAGRVTTLTARPLLRVFFPELAHFEQPLGGIIAARRSLLRKLRFENDYGVDVGLFLDAAALGAQLAEVDIGHIEHESHPLEVLGDMAMQVVRAILERAARDNRLRLSHIREVAEVERHMQAELSIVLQKVGKPERLALFDMDGTLLQGRFTEVFARRVGCAAKLQHYLDNFTMPAEERTRKIAALFKGVPREVFEETALGIPLMPGAGETVTHLRKAGYRVGIVTDGFRIPAETVRRRVFADFSIAHMIKFARGKSTGLVTLAAAMAHSNGCLNHPYCKLNVMLNLLERMNIAADQVLAVGDGDNDVCMLRGAGTSIAFRPKSAAVQSAAQHVLHGDLAEILQIIVPRPLSLGA